MNDASKRIIAKIMRGLTKLPIGISHGFPGLSFGHLHTPIRPILICRVKPKLFYSAQHLWRAPALRIFPPAKFWIHAAIPRSKQMCGSKAERLDERRFPAERAQANMKHCNCATATKAASAGKA